MLAAPLALAGCSERAFDGGEDPIACEGLDRAWADRVVRYDPTALGGVAPGNADFARPSEALGPIDYTGGGAGTGAVSLGHGGFLELGFVDCVMSTSGDAAPDLVIHEVGPLHERVFVALAPVDDASLDPSLALGDGLYFALAVDGSTVEIDIDAVLGLDAPTSFNRIRLADDPDEGSHGASSPGADIDAIEILYPTSP